MLQPINWNALRGRTFRTVNGAQVTVVKVTPKSVIIRPEHGRRKYDLAIQNELEQSLDAIWAGKFFATPTDLVRVGVREERNSYVWGILRAVWDEQVGQQVSQAMPKEFAGERTGAIPQIRRSWAIYRIVREQSSQANGGAGTSALPLRTGQAHRRCPYTQGRHIGAAPTKLHTFRHTARSWL